MTRRFDRRARALSVLATAVTGSLLHAQTFPTTAPTTVPTTQPVTMVVPGTRPNGASPATRPATKISLEFKDASVDSVLDYLSEAAGFIVVKETPVEGRVSIISRRPVSAEEALTLLNAALKPNGYTAIQQGRVLKVVLREKAKKQNIPVHFGIDPQEVAETDELITQVIPLKTIDAAKLRQDLQPLISADADYTANQGSNSLILTDTSSNIRRIVAIVAKLDQHEQLASDIYIKQLTFANAAAAAKLIGTIFGEQGQNEQGGGGGRGGGGSRFFRAMLMGGGAPGIGGAGAGQDAGKPGVKVTAAADDRTNTLVVVAPTDTIKLIEKLLKVLDSDPASASDIRVFQLVFADAASAAKLINNVFQVETQGGGGGGRGDGGAQGARLPALESLTPADRNVKVNAAAADHTNTLVVTAPPDTMKLIAKILQVLDSDPAAMSEVKVFQLKYADSASAAKLLSSVFQTDAASQQQQPQQQGAAGRLPALGGLTTSLHGGRVNASSDDRTNTLVVTAPPDAMKIITSILSQLDSNPSAESSLFIYHLRNGVAQDIQTTMSSLFSSGSTGTGSNTSNNRNAGQSLLSSGLGGSSGFGGGNSGRSGLGGSGGGLGGSNSSFGAPLTSTNNTNRSSGSSSGASNAGANIRATSELVGQVIVVADIDTNSLLVSTANRYKEQVMKIIEELDRPVPQVLIKVLVAEVTHDRTNDFGIDFSILDTRATGKGLTVAQGLANGAAAAAPTAGLVVSLMENNLNATLHALATEGKLDVLSRPYILASDNQQASITVGQEVPFITNTQITDTGQQINTIQYQAVGIILNVTPHINPDGAVTLDVAPEISAISATSVPIGNNISAPVIDNRSAQSRVTIRSGNTIVIGGLMQDQKSTTISKIPILGDIPYLGALFTRHQDDRMKTELLIFLTPHLAQQPDALKPMSADEMKGTKETPHAVEPGTFQDHMKGMDLGETPFKGTTRPAVIDFKPAPSTQPFNGVTISEPSGAKANPPGTGIEK